MTDEQILEYYGWEIVCRSPFNIEHKDGSYATGEAVRYVTDMLRDQYIFEQYEKLERRVKRLRMMEDLLNKMNEDE